MSIVLVHYAETYGVRSRARHREITIGKALGAVGVATQDRVNSQHFLKGVELRNKARVWITESI